jgi:hypothetical protein
MRRPASRDMPRIGMITEARTNRTHVGSGTWTFCHYHVRIRTLGSVTGVLFREEGALRDGAVEQS